VAISVVDGVMTGIVRSAPGKCVGEYTSLTTVVLDSTEDGSFHGVGCRWGDPDDLLANLCVDGCCTAAELTIGTETTIQARQLILSAQPKGRLRTELKQARQALGVAQAATAQLQAANQSLTAQLVSANEALIRCRTAQDAGDLAGLVPKVRKLSDRPECAASGDRPVTRFGDLPWGDNPCI
jgi:hypothetical protein